MKMKKAKSLKIYINETDKLEHTPLHEAIVFAAKHEHLSGATVTRGIMSFGPSSRIHTLKIADLTDSLPVIIEIIDDAQKIESFLSKHADMFDKIYKNGLIVLSEVEVFQ